MLHLKSFHLKFHPRLFQPTFWFVVALVIRMMYLLEQGGISPLFYNPLLDEREGIDSAMAIIQGVTSAEPYFKAPGYSWVLAAIIGVSGDAWPWTVRAMQHLAGAWLVGMAAWFAGLLSPAGSWRRTAILLSGIIAAVYAPLIRLESNLSLDFWSVFFQSAMLCILARVVVMKSARRGALLAGFLAAAAWIIRPTITLVLPFLTLWLAFKHRTKVSKAGIVAGPASFGVHRMLPKIRIDVAILFLLPMLILVCAVVTRNYATSGEAIVMPWQGGYNLYHANRPGATGRYYLQGGVVETAYANPTRHLAIDGYRQGLNPVARLAFDREPEYSAVDRYWFQRTLEVVRLDPLSWAKLMARKAVYLWSDKEIFNYEDFDLQRDRSPVLRWMPGRFGVVFPLAMASLATLGLTGWRRRRIYELGWIYTITLGGAIALYYVSGRMRMPLAFPMIAFAGYAAAALPHLKTSRKLIGALLVIAGVMLSWGDWWGVRSESMAHVDLTRMSNAAWKKGDPRQALDLVLQAEKLSPDYPAIPSLKGQALYSLGRIKESRAEFLRSVQLLGDKTSRNNLKTIDEELAQ